MHLNGWQRLWVALAVLWTLAVGGWTWTAWPARPLLVVASEDLPHESPVSYYDALDRERGGKYDFTGIFEKVTGLIVDVPGFGKIQFPADMDKAEVEKACQTLLKARADRIKNINAAPLREFQARRTSTAQVALAVWLLPPLTLLAFGWAVRWVYRGFPNMPTAVRLSGWQRLWVVLAVLWTLSVGFTTWQTWPASVSVPPDLDDNGNPIPRTFAEDLAALRAEESIRVSRINDAEFAALLWLLPPAALYGLGLAAGWVYRGFKKSPQ